MDQKYDDDMFEGYRTYLGELYKSPQDYLYLSRYVFQSHRQSGTEFLQHVKSIVKNQNAHK